MRLNFYGEYLPSKTDDCLKGCKLCLQVCPFGPNVTNEDILAQKRFLPEPDIQHNFAAGFYLSCYVGYASDNDLRINSASGGIGTWLLETLLSESYVDKVICVTAAKDPEKLFCFEIFSDAASLRSASGSVYYPVELSGILHYISENEARYAIIGLPCFLKGLLLAKDNNPRLKKRILFLLGLTCGHMKSSFFSYYLALKAGAVKKPISVNFRNKDRDLPANRYFFSCEDELGRQRTLSFLDGFATAWQNRFFALNACNFCDDVFAETADITLMDAWLPQYYKNCKGTNLLIVRTSLLRDILHKGAENKHLHLEKIAIGDVVLSQQGVVSVKRKQLPGRLKLALKNNAAIPTKRVAPAQKISFFARKKAVHQEYVQQQSKKIFYETCIRSGPNISAFSRDMSHRQKKIVKWEKLQRKLRYLKKKRRKTLFILAGNGSYENRGCEAILKSTVKILRHYFPQASFVAISHFQSQRSFARQKEQEKDKDIIHKKFTKIHRRFAWSWFLQKFYSLLYPTKIKYFFCKEIFPYLKDAAAVLSIGGDNYSLEYGIPKSFTLLDELVLENKKPVFIWGASVGPFDARPDYEPYILKHLSKISAIFARESRSISYLEKKGINTNVVKVSDPAFLLEKKKPAEEKFSQVISEDSIGINLSPLMAQFVTGGDQDAWRNLSVEIINTISKKTKKPIFLTYHSTTPKSDDYAFLKQIYSRIEKNTGPVFLLPPGLDAQELKWVIGSLAVFAGARMHSVIAALSSEVPTLSLGYSIKSEGINFDIFGHNDYCISVAQMQPDLIADKIVYLLENSTEIKKHLLSVMPRIKEEAMRAGFYLKDISGK